nr:angiopoietin-1-like isoform X4 [Crassostrea virginica]
MLFSLILGFLFVAQTNSLSSVSDNKPQPTGPDGQTTTCRCKTDDTQSDILRQLLNQETLIRMTLDKKVSDLANEMAEMKNYVKISNKQFQDAKWEIEANNNQLQDTKRKTETNNNQLKEAEREIETNKQQLKVARAEIVSLRNEVLLVKDQNRKSKADELKFQEKMNVRFVTTEENIAQVVNTQEQFKTNLNERFETFQINTSYNIVDIQTKMDVLSVSLLDLKNQTKKMNTSLPDVIDKKITDVSAYWNTSLTELNHRFVYNLSKMDNDHVDKIAQLSDGINNTLNTIKAEVDQTQKAQLEMSSVVSSAVSSLEVIRQSVYLFHKEDYVDCSIILRLNPDMKGQDGVYTIYPDKVRNKTVYCDMTTEGGGWTVIQNRIDGSTDFYRTWKEYKEGFGNSSHNYWIGNDVIHQLTKDKNHVLRVELQKFSGEKGYAEYSTFIVGDEQNKYKLTVAGYKGNIDGINNTLNTIKTEVDQTQKVQLELSSVVSSAVSSLEVIRQSVYLFHKEDYVDCSIILRENPYTKGQDGVYTIYSDKNRYKTVYCDMTTEGGGWTVIQNRIDGSTDFYRTWKEYKEGFGNSSHNYWIGNDVIHQLTKDKTQVLRVELQRFSGEKGYAEYSTFIVDDEQSKYKLTVAGYKGNIRDYLNYHNGSKFSTPDQDNDRHGGSSCAQKYHGAWCWRGGSRTHHPTLPPPHRHRVPTPL